MHQYIEELELKAKLFDRIILNAVPDSADKTIGTYIFKDLTILIEFIENDNQELFELKIADWNETDN